MFIFTMAIFLIKNTAYCVAVTYIEDMQAGLVYVNVKLEMATAECGDMGFQHKELFGGAMSVQLPMNSVDVRCALFSKITY